MLSFSRHTVDIYVKLYHVKSGHELISTWGSLKDYLVRAIQFGGPPQKLGLNLGTSRIENMKIVGFSAIYPLG